MTPYQILWDLPIAATGLSVLLLIVATLQRKERLLLVTATLILTNANTAAVSAITADLGLGLGSASFLMDGVLLVLLWYYRVNPIRVLFPRHGWPGVLLFLTLCYMLVISPIVSIDRVDTVRRSLSYLLVYALGWGAFGLIFSHRPELTRERVYTILYTGGMWSLVMLFALLLVAGPHAFRGEIGGLWSTITLGSITVSQLQAPGMNATGVAMSAASSVFLIIHLWQMWSRSRLKRLILAAVLFVVTIVFLWSAGRTAMLAFAGTVILLLLLVTIVRRGKHRFTAVLFLLLLGLALIPLTDILAGLFLRGGASSLLDAFRISRLDLALKGVSLYRSYLVWGTGPGVLLASYSAGDIIVESFFIRILIELGAVGGTIYLIAWLTLTYYVIKVDVHYMRLGYPATWLPSSFFIFIWVTSPASFGFSIFDGGLALNLAIAAAAAVEWKRIRDEERQRVIQHRKNVSEVMKHA